MAGPSWEAPGRAVADTAADTAADEANGAGAADGAGVAAGGAARDGPGTTGAVTGSATNAARGATAWIGRIGARKRAPTRSATATPKSTASVRVRRCRRSTR